MANAYFYSNIASPTTLSGNINNSVTSCTVASTTGWPGTTPYIIALDYGTANEELVKVTVNASGTLTVTRAFGGTTAVAHSTGAAVRHVYNAQDATDWRTHEAATAAAHGIGGSFVGTTDIQTLTNKTLTAPAITNPAISGGGSMAGTFSGTPTFSGAVVLSGVPSISNGAALAGTFSGAPTFSGAVAFSGNPVFTGVPTLSGATAVLQASKVNIAQQFVAAGVSGDAFDRYRLFPDGTMEFGTGAAARDTFFGRIGTKIMGVTGTMMVQPTDTALDGLAVNLPTATGGDLLNLRVNNNVQAAMGNDGAYRIYQGNSPTTFTPTVTGGGTVTWTTRTGWYHRIGKMIYVAMHFVVNAAGSGAANFQVDAPTGSVNGATDQILLTHFQSGTTRTGYTVHFMGGTGATFDRIRVQDGGAADTVANLQGSNLTAGAVLVIQGWYREN